MSRKEKWSSLIASSLAFMGATIGIGSLWRFPYKVGVCGGGSFVLAYFVCYIALTLPVYMAETAIGKASKRSLARCFEEISGSKRWSLLGDATVVVGTTLNAQYLVVVGWTLLYIGYSLMWPQVPPEVLFEATFPSFWSLVGLFFACLICSVIVARGISFMERVYEVLMPLLFIILSACCVYACFLPGFWETLSFLFYPKIETLSDPALWLTALGQAYFTAALGIGFMIAYGAYMEEQPIPENSFLAALGDNIASILAGIAIFAVVFSYGLSPAAGASLAFISLMKAFQAIPLGQVLAFLFYLSFSAAAIASTKPAFEVFAGYAVEKFGMKRWKASALAGLIQFALGVPAALSTDVFYAYDFGWTVLPPLISLFTIAFLIKAWGISEAEKVVVEGSKIKAGKYFAFCTKYIAPVGISAILIGYALALVGKLHI